MRGSLERADPTVQLALESALLGGRGGGERPLLQVCKKSLVPHASRNWVNGFQALDRAGRKNLRAKMNLKLQVLRLCDP